MKKIVLIGGGGHCKSVLDTIKRLNSYDEIVISDSKFPANKKVLDIDIICNDEMLSDLKKIGFDEAFITVGNINDTSMRQNLYKKASDLGFVFPNIIDPSAVVSDYAVLENGIFIGKGAVVNADAHIEKMAIINTNAIIEHECIVGKYAHIATGAVLCGNVSVGDYSFIGAGTTIIQGISIGVHSVLGAGSIVLQNVKEWETVKGLVK